MDMIISKIIIMKNTKAQLTFLQPDFHASLHPLQENGKVQKITDLSGRQLCRLLSNADPGSQFLKTLLDCSPFWSQRVCLKWKIKHMSFLVKVTKRKKLSNQLKALNEESLEGSLLTSKQQDIRSRNSKTAPQSFCVFQLAVSTLPTDETGYGLLPTVKATEVVAKAEQVTGKRKVRNGKQYSNTLQDLAVSGLLPTPQARDEKAGSDIQDPRMQRKLEKNWTANLNDLAKSGLLPTPTVMDTNQGDLEKIDKRRAKALASKINGNGFGVTLGELANRGLLPTPQSAEGFKLTGLESQDSLTKRVRIMMDKPLLATPTKNEGKGARSKAKVNDNKRQGAPTLRDHISLTGQTGRLNPLFVLEMMGYPSTYTLLPFLNQQLIRMEA
jgi:hypothetical protein